MIDLKLKPAALDGEPDSSFRYYEPAIPTDGADRWHLGTATYRLVSVAVPLDGGEPIVTLVRQTAKGRDYARSGRRVHTLRYIASVIDGDVNRIRAHVQQVRDALVRVGLDELLAEANIPRDSRNDDPDDGCCLCGGLPGDRARHWPECSRGIEPEAGSWTAPVIPVDESGPMLDNEETSAEHRQGVETLRLPPLGDVPDDDEAIARMLLDRRDDHAYGSEVCAAMCRRWGNSEAYARWYNVLSVCDRLVGEEASLDASMREQMAQWPDDTLALTTVGELRDVLRRAVEAGATVVDDDSVIVQQLIRELPIPAEERAAHGLTDGLGVCDCDVCYPEGAAEDRAERGLAGPIKVYPGSGRAADMVAMRRPLLPNVGRRESFERPGSAYDSVLGYDAERRAVVPSSTSRLVRLPTRHPEPGDCKGDEYGTWVALGGMLAEYLADNPTLTGADIRVVAAHFNVSPFAVLDLLDKRGIAHEPNPVLVPEGSEVEP